MRQINEAGLALIKEFEGCKLEAYTCPGGVLTIGYGHTADVYPGQTITEAQAETLLREDLARFEDGIARLVSVALTDNQFAALVSWAFNVGLGAVEKSTLRRLLNAGDYGSVPGQLARWNKAGGKVLAGLTRRRAAEAVLWASEVAPAGQSIVPDDPIKPLAKSKELGFGIAGGVAMVTGQLDAVAEYVPAGWEDAWEYVVAAVIVGYVANRLWARYRGER